MKHKQQKKIHRTVQDLKVGNESKQKTQTKGDLEVKILGAPTGNSEARVTNRMQEMEDGILVREVLLYMYCFIG